jgi:hypothetical protein
MTTQKDKKVLKMFVPKIADKFIPSLMRFTENDTWLGLMQDRRLNTSLELWDSVQTILMRCGWSVVEVEIKEL